MTRAVKRLGDEGALQTRAERVLDSIALLRIDDSILATAGTLGPPTLRTLDAIHLATALSVRDALEGVIVYDRDLAEAAEVQGLTVLAPGA